MHVHSKPRGAKGLSNPGLHTQRRAQPYLAESRGLSGCDVDAKARYLPNLGQGLKGAKQDKECNQPSSKGLAGELSADSQIA